MFIIDIYKVDSHFPTSSFSSLHLNKKTKNASHRSQNYPTFVALVSHNALSTAEGVKTY